MGSNLVQGQTSYGTVEQSGYQHSHTLFISYRHTLYRVKQEHNMSKQTSMKGGLNACMLRF